MTTPIRTALAIGLATASSFAATLSAPDQTANPGDSVLASVALSSGGQTISGAQFDLVWSTGLELQFATGAQAGISAKTLYAQVLQPRVVRCLVLGLNRTALSDGELIRLFVTVDSNAGAGARQFSLLNLSATDQNGAPVFLTGGQVTVQVQGGSATQVIQPSNVLNAASLAAGSISPGEIVTIFGSLSGSSPTVLFNNTPATILYAGAGQVNAIVPFGLDVTNPAQIQIQQGSSIATGSLPAASAALGIFTKSGSGTGAGAILNQDYRVNAPATPAARGSTIMIYATGFGALTPLPVDGQIAAVLATTPSAVTATIDGVPAQVTYAGAAPGLIAGVTQINVQVPNAVTPNLAAPISLTMGSFTTPPGVTVSIK